MGGNLTDYNEMFNRTYDLVRDQVDVDKISVRPELQNLVTQISNTSKLREACNGTATTAVM